jgi:endo-1,4-beta-mannosidase
VRFDSAATEHEYHPTGCIITRSRDGLDWVVNEARDFGIRIIMVLTDSQGDYGGMAQYVRWAGPLTETVRDFYASKRIRVSVQDTCPLALYHLSMYSCAAGHH